MARYLLAVVTRARLEMARQQTTANPNPSLVELLHCGKHLLQRVHEFRDLLWQEAHISAHIIGRRFRHEVRTTVRALSTKEQLDRALQIITERVAQTKDFNIRRHHVLQNRIDVSVKTFKLCVDAHLRACAPSAS